VSSEGVKQVSKDKYIEILSRVCHSRSALPASFILPDVVSGKTDESGKFVPRKRGDPAVRAPDKFAAHVPGVDIREGQQAGKLVRIMVFRVREKAMKEVERVCVLTVSKKQTRTSFSTEALLWDCEEEIHFTPERVALPRGFGATIPVLDDQPLDAKREHLRLYPTSVE